MTAGDRKVLDAPVLFKGEHHVDSIQHGSVPSGALRQSYAVLNSKDRFVAQWWRPRNDHRIVDETFQSILDTLTGTPTGQNGVAWESGGFIHEVWDRLHCHVVYFATSDSEAIVTHSLTIGSTTGDAVERDVGDYDWTEENGWLSASVPAIQEDIVSLDIPSASKGTMETLQVNMELALQDVNSGAAYNGAWAYSILGVTIFGVTV